MVVRKKQLITFIMTVLMFHLSFIAFKEEYFVGFLKIQRYAAIALIGLVFINMYCLRHEQYYISKNNKLGRLLRLYWARRKNTIGNRIGFYIGATVFEPGITIYHHGTIIINGNAAIGQGCCLHGNNCIGNDGKSGGAPVIGKNVDIGFGAVIIGDIQIADNCKIGAGAVVVHSCLEEGSTLVGVPARRV